MSFTLNQYIVNPLLQRGRVLSALMRETARKDYTDRFNKLNLRENSRWTYRLYKDTEHNAFYIHIKVPSEKIKQFYYDVVFKFYTDADVSDNGRDLNNYYVQMFANDPSFCYTYAYVFLHNDLIVPDLISKVGDLAAKKPPDITNPTQETGYVKSIYFAYLFMQNRGLNRLINFEASAVEYNKSVLLSNIMDMDEKVHQRELEGKRVDAQKKRTKEIAKKNKEKHLSRLTPQEKQHNVIRDTTKVNKVKSTKKTKTSKTIKMSKKSK